MNSNQKVRSNSQKITPFLWFDHEAEEAMHYYVSIFENSEVKKTLKGPDGKVQSVVFQLGGQKFMALNGGPRFQFTEAISFFVQCKDQAEVDFFWDKFISDGGEEQACGWLKDKYGLCWQIIPDGLIQLLYHQDDEKSRKATEAMLKMKKIDINVLRNV